MGRGEREGGDNCTTTPQQRHTHPAEFVSGRAEARVAERSVGADRTTVFAWPL